MLSWTNPRSKTEAVWPLIFHLTNHQTCGALSLLFQVRCIHWSSVQSMLKNNSCIIWQEKELKLVDITQLISRYSIMYLYMTHPHLPKKKRCLLKILTGVQLSIFFFFFFFFFFYKLKFTLCKLLIRRHSWPNDYCNGKWTWWHKLKSWRMLLALCLYYLE